jgi:hypothetical protein
MVQRGLIWSAARSRTTESARHWTPGGTEIASQGQYVTIELPDSAVLAIAFLADGRILRRLGEVPAGNIVALAASPDGGALYYVAAGSVWAVSTTGGEPHRIGPGDAVAADPGGNDLIVQLIGQEGVRLVRVAGSGGSPQPIPIKGDLLLAPMTLSPSAIGKDGRMVVSITAPDSWFYGAGVLGPRTGRLERIPLHFTGDILGPGWLDDGRVLASGWPLRDTLWRFSPESAKQ